MNIILFKDEELKDSITSLPANSRRGLHILKILKVKKNDNIKIGIINGNLGRGKISNITEDSIDIEAGHLNEPPPPPLPATLIFAMQRPKTVRKILQSATAMGVKSFYIIETWKVDKSYWNSPILKTEELEKELQLGLEQSCDTVMPKVQIKRRFKPFVEDKLPGIIKNSNAFIAHPYATSPCPYNTEGPATIAIGPEGGFTEYELRKMQDTGMSPINIGTRPLRSEFAVTAILAKLF